MKENGSSYFNTSPLLMYTSVNVWSNTFFSLCSAQTHEGSGLHVWLEMWRSWVRAPSKASLFPWARNFTLIA